MSGSGFKVEGHANTKAALSTDGGNRFGHAGDFAGTVGLFDFGKISHLIAQTDFERLQRRYATEWSDMQTVTVRVQTARGEVTVADYGGAGPVELWAVERAIEAIGFDSTWKPR